MFMIVFCEYINFHKRWTGEISNGQHDSLQVPTRVPLRFFDKQEASHTVPPYTCHVVSSITGHCKLRTPFSFGGCGVIVNFMPCMRITRHLEAKLVSPTLRDDADVSFFGVSLLPNPACIGSCKVCSLKEAYILQGQIQNIAKGGC